MDPNPPITVTISPLIVKGTVITGDSIPTAAAVIAPAIPPKNPAIEKVIEFVR